MHFFYFLLVLHWVADFVCQSHYMATNKSRNNTVLALHVSVYSLIMMVGVLLSAYLFSVQGLYGIDPIYFYLGVWIPHFVVDWVTSRITARLWKAERWHDFFVVIGLDQLIHYGCVFFWIEYLLNT